MRRDKIDEIKLLKNIPQDILDAISRNKTSIGNNEIINGLIDDDFLEGLATSEFDAAKLALKNIGKISWANDDDSISSILNKLISKCQEIEENHKDELEKVCLNVVNSLFGIPTDYLTIEAELVRKIEINPKATNIDKVKLDSWFKDIQSGEAIKAECDKRRIINALNIGAAMYYSSDESLYSEDIKKIDDRLPELYKQIIAINTYVLFEKNDLGITEDNNMCTGTETVSFGGYDYASYIKASGIVFPILLCEAIRGVMEFVSCHGLPSNKEDRKKVISLCDYIKGEPWNMRLGKELWKRVYSEFGGMGKMIPYWYNEFVSLSPRLFSKVSKEILSHTDAGRDYSKKILKKAIRQFDKDNFDSSMSKLSIDKTIITDETIN